MRVLSRDPVTIVTAIGIVTLAVFSLALPVPAPLIETVGWWADFVLLAICIAVTWRASRDDGSEWGRRFWRLQTAALCLWYSVLVIWQASLGDLLRFNDELFSDYLFLAYYFTLLLATAVKPHDRAAAARLSPIAVTEIAAGLVLAFGLAAYFVILPSRLTPKGYETYVPSLSLYVVLDLILVSRVAWWCRTAVGSHWRSTYCLLTAAFTFTLLHDIHELLVYREGQTLAPSAWDLVWWGQFICLIAAARGTAHRAGAVDADVGAPADARSAHGATIGSVASFAFLLPVIHLAGKAANLLDPALDAPRELVVLTCAVILGALAVLHQKQTTSRYRAVSQNLHEAQVLLQQSRKMEALGRLAGGVAHEFNNLLSVIVGYTELLAERLGPGGKDADSLVQIRFAAERAATLTRQLATFSRGRLDREVAIDLDRAVGGVMPTIRRLVGERVEVRFTPASQGAWVEVNPHQFERALLNIAANAHAAMPDGGSLELGTRSLVLRENESLAFGQLPPGWYVEVTARDTGHGMDEEVRSRLFEPFFTTRSAEGRQGLGLPIVYGVVRQASGHISVDSRPGAGTTVHIYLPRRQAAPGAEADAAVPVDRPATILLAEDERGLRRLMRSTLERDGYTVLEAADGGTAVDLADHHTGTIDLLLSDVVMPVLAGPDVARRVLASRPETRVLFISGYAPETLGDLRVPGTETSLLPKPFAMADLLAKVHEFLPLPGGRGGGDAGPGPGNIVAV